MSFPRYPKYKAAGLLGARVQVVADHLGEGRCIPLRGGDIGRIGWHYPVNGSIFDLSVEAPVEGLSTLPHGALGVPGGCCGEWSD